MKINITIYNKEADKYISDVCLDLAGIPRVGDKIVYDDKNSQAQVYIVDEIMYGDNEWVTVYAHRIDSQWAYNERRGLIS